MVRDNRASINDIAMTSCPPLKLKMKKKNRSKPTKILLLQTIQQCSKVRNRTVTRHWRKFYLNTIAHTKQTCSLEACGKAVTCCWLSLPYRITSCSHSCSVCRLMFLLKYLKSFSSRALPVSYSKLHVNHQSTHSA